MSRRGSEGRNHLDAGEGLRVDGGKRFPPFSHEPMKAGEKKLSIFVDESGSFLYPDSDSRFYIIGMVFHDQADDIAAQLAELSRNIEDIGIDAETFVFHAGPLIRREQGYEFMNRRLRERIFARMMSFARKVDFSYKCVWVDKKYTTGFEQLACKLKYGISGFLRDAKMLLDRFDTVKVYYDSGQSILTNILHDSFKEILGDKVVFAQKVRPVRYRLFQLADLVCTMQLVRLKLESNISMSQSETRFFGGPKSFKHNILRRIKAKEFRFS